MKTSALATLSSASTSTRLRERWIKAFLAASRLCMGFPVETLEGALGGISTGDVRRVLRKIDFIQDAPALHAIFGDEESCRYLPSPATSSVEETRVQLSQWASPEGGAEWAICATPDGPALGRAALLPVRPKLFEAAIMMAPAARGRGLALTAMAAALAHAFDHLGARRIFADIDPDNTPSLKLFEKLGFQREAYLREEWETHIGVRDTIIMALIKSDPQDWRRFTD